jgi:hypothetical protein
LPPEIKEQFVACRESGSITYRPVLLGQAKLHFAQTATAIDYWQDISLLLPIRGEVPAEPWTKAQPLNDEPDFDSNPQSAAQFAALPAELSRPKRYTELASALKDHLYREQKLRLWKCPSLKQTSKAGESESDFRVRLAHQAREERDTQVEELRQSFAPKIAALQERIRKAQIKVEKEKAQATEKTMSAALSIGASIVSALFSRKLTSSGNISRAATSMRQATRIARERQDVSDANESVGVLSQRLSDLEAELAAQTEKIQTDLAPDKLSLQEITIQPKKSEVSVQSVILVWLPATDAAS